MALVSAQGDLSKGAVDAPKIEFPCENYMIKIVATESDDVLSLIQQCMEMHVPDVDHTNVTHKRSSKGVFISYTYRITATSENQLAMLHKALISHTAIKMVL